MVKSRLEKIIIIHPHREFDMDLKCKEYIDEMLGGFSGRDEAVLVVQGYKEDEGRNPTNEKLEIYLNRDTDYQVTNSRNGEIDGGQLKRFIENGIRIQLPGGIIGQCHKYCF